MEDWRLAMDVKEEKRRKNAKEMTSTFFMIRNRMRLLLFSSWGPACASTWASTWLGLESATNTGLILKTTYVYQVTMFILKSKSFFL